MDSQLTLKKKKILKCFIFLFVAVEKLNIFCLRRHIQILNSFSKKIVEKKIVKIRFRLFYDEKLFFLVDSPLRGGGKGFKFVTVEGFNIFCLRQHNQILILVY